MFTTNESLLYNLNTASEDEFMWTPVPLTFLRSPHELPTPLPSTSQIRQSEDVLRQRTGHTIVTIGPEFLAKYGFGTHAREGQTLLYLEHSLPQVPAPRLHAMYFYGDELSIVMERIRGSDLSVLWDSMSNEDKSSITQSLRGIFDCMRQALGPSPTFFGAVDDGPVPHHLFWDPNKDPKCCGPFDDENQFNFGLLAQYKKIQEENKLPLFKHEFYSSHLGDVLNSHRSTLTPGYVQRKNIMVIDQTQDTPKRLQSCRVVLVDWEDAGCYPDYWEYFAAFVTFRWNDDWPSRVEDFIDAHAAESAIMAMIYRELFF